MTIEIYEPYSFQEFLLEKVPPIIARLQEQGGPREMDWEAAFAFSDALAFRGDVLQFVFDAQSKSEKQDARSSRDDMAQHVATAAFCPGGIETFGVRFIASVQGVTIERQEQGWPGPFPATHQERKQTGSYYTPRILIDGPNCLLDTALEPSLAEKLKEDPDHQHALLSMAVCDPACGSGAFLLCATERLVKHLVSIRYGDQTPTRAQWRRIRRDIVGHCIYGVDLNPTAVELCKLTLWFQALDPESSLPFLDAHIQCGNGILGTRYDLMRNGIPDKAFEPIEGDDKKLASAYKKRNKAEREKGPGLFALPPSGIIPDYDIALSILALAMRQIDAMPDDTPERWQEKRATYQRYLRTDIYQWNLLRANAWCAAFVWRKTSEMPDAITESVFRKIERDPANIAPWMRDEINRLAKQYTFFHWELAYPQIMYGREEQEKRITAVPENKTKPVQASLWDAAAV